MLSVGCIMLSPTRGIVLLGKLGISGSVLSVLSANRCVVRCVLRTRSILCCVGASGVLRRVTSGIVHTVLPVGRGIVRSMLSACSIVLGARPAVLRSMLRASSRVVFRAAASVVLGACKQEGQRATQKRSTSTWKQQRPLCRAKIAVSMQRTAGPG